MKRIEAITGTKVNSINKVSTDLHLIRKCSGFIQRMVAFCTTLAIFGIEKVYRNVEMTIMTTLHEK